MSPAEILRQQMQKAERELLGRVEPGRANREKKFLEQDRRPKIENIKGESLPPAFSALQKANDQLDAQVAAEVHNYLTIAATASGLPATFNPDTDGTGFTT